MYLAHIKDKYGRNRFFIRESYRGEDGLIYARDLYDLGDDPEIFIKYVGPKGFYIDQDLDEAVRERASSYSYDDLEALFWPFLDPYIKATIKNFSHGHIRGGRRRFRGRSRREKEEERARLKESLDQGLHPFDRRRLLFLKFGQINIEHMLDEPFPFLEWPLKRSRDEIEHTIGFMELELRPWEMRGYLYTIFNIPEHLKPRQSRFVPDAQDLNAIDGYFLEELCKLNSDRTYLDQGAMELDTPGVHPYLRKYLIYYFDTFFHSQGAGYIGGRFRKEGTHAPAKSSHENEEEYLELFGLTIEEFHAMDEKALTSLFRKLALKLHPDKGGEHEKFIRLKDAYAYLMRRKGW